MGKIECDKFQRPSGVAVGPDGAVYVTDDRAQSLFKFSEDGKLCKTVQKFKFPYFVNTIQGHVYVSDFEIKIFDVDCNAIGSIATSEYPGPRDIAEHDGNLYVGSYWKKSTNVILVVNIYVMSILRNVSGLEVYVLTSVVISM